MKEKLAKPACLVSAIAEIICIALTVYYLINIFSPAALCLLGTAIILEAFVAGIFLYIYAVRL